MIPNRQPRYPDREKEHTGDLLEHLIDVGQNNTVEVAVRAHSEQVFERTLGHLQDGGLDLGKLGLDILGFLGISQQGSQDFTSLVFLALKDEPAGRLGQEHDGTDDDQGKEDLERERESPGNGIRIGE